MALANFCWRCLCRHPSQRLVVVVVVVVIIVAVVVVVVLVVVVVVVVVVVAALRELFYLQLCLGVFFLTVAAF